MFGDPEADPCFGKLYDLMDDTCLSCGDIEWCATIFHQKLIKSRLDEEKKGNNLDLVIDGLEFERDVRDFYKAQLETLGGRKVKAISNTSKRFNTTRPKIKQIVNGY